MEPYISYIEPMWSKTWNLVSTLYIDMIVLSTTLYMYFILFMNMLTLERQQIYIVVHNRMVSLQVNYSWKYFFQPFLVNWVR